MDTLVEQAEAKPVARHNLLRDFGYDRQLVSRIEAMCVLATTGLSPYDRKYARLELKRMINDRGKLFLGEEDTPSMRYIYLSSKDMPYWVVSAIIPRTMAATFEAGIVRLVTLQ